MRSSDLTASLFQIVLAPLTLYQGTIKKNFWINVLCYLINVFYDTHSLFVIGFISLATENRAMASTRLRQFDPAEHPGNVFDAFCEFVDRFTYEYEAVAKPAPTGTTDLEAWTAIDKRKQFLGRYSSWNLQKDYEDETTAAERVNISFADTVTKLKARYKPSRNQTLANFEFHKLQQRPTESFDEFVNRVKHEAASCDFSCENPTCSVRKTLIRDQIVIGTTDDEIRKSALKDEWSLADLQAKGRKIEAASHGAAKIKKEVTENEVRRLPGKYSKKGQNGQSKPSPCRNCSNKACKGGDKCPGREVECFACGKKGHFKGAANCKGKKKEKSVRASRKGDASESEQAESSSSSEEGSVNRIAATGVSAARFVAHIRRSTGSARKRSQVIQSKYQVPVILKEKEVLMFADTGADISVVPKSLADELELPLVRTKMRIKPYGMQKRIRCVGYYVGPVMYEGEVANVGLYVVKGEVEPLLSGAASEALGIISFNGTKDAGVRRCSAETDPVKKKYISKYPSIFQGVGKLADYTVKYHIDPNVPPVACPEKSPPYHLQGKLDKAIEKMEKAGVIEDHVGPAPWRSNLVLSPKPDGDIRVTVDMRAPNEAILDTGLPIPKPEDIRKELKGCKVFSKLDFRTAFHQLALDEASRVLTVFPHKGKLKRHTRLTMGAKPASGELNKALRPLFSNLPAAHIIHDDLVVATATEEEHELALDQVLQVIAKANLTLNLDKCLFKKKAIPFWGLMISGEGVMPDPAKVLALKEATHPESKSELMSFLCLLQASAEFIPHLSKETTHLRNMTKKSVRFRWDKTCQQEFDRLKGLLCENALLTYFDTGLPTFVIVDAHRTGLSAILAQGDSLDSVRIVSCASRATSPVERRYHQLDLEALAIDFGLRRFRNYLAGGPQCTVVTDHKPLVSIFKSVRQGSVRTDRIKLRHQDISYQVVYSPGQHNLADFLSRHALDWKKIPATWREEAGELEKTVWFLNLSPYSEAVSLPRIIEESQKDKTLAQLADFIKKGYIPKSAGDHWKPYRSSLDTITTSDTGLFLKGEKIILPRSLWQVAIDKAHQGGHPGESRLKSRVRSHFWIPGLDRLVKEKVSSCRHCQLYTPKSTTEPIATQKTTGKAWEEVSVDLFGPLPNKKHVLVVQDTMSRFPAAKIVSGTSATTVINALDEVYTSYGQPDCHRTDNGPTFSSAEFNSYSKSKGIEHVLTYPHHPQGNPCETFMKPLGKALKAAFFNRDSAQQALDELLRAYRSTPHPATGEAPSQWLPVRLSQAIH